MSCKSAALTRLAMVTSSASAPNSRFLFAESTQPVRKSAVRESKKYLRFIFSFLVPMGSRHQAQMAVRPARGRIGRSCPAVPQATRARSSRMLGSWTKPTGLQDRNLRQASPPQTRCGIYGFSSPSMPEFPPVPCSPSGCCGCSTFGGSGSG